MRTRKHTKVTASKGGVRIQPGSGIKDQAGMWNFMRGLAGQDPAPLCEECGGLLSEDGPSSGKCKCQKVES